MKANEGGTVLSTVRSEDGRIDRRGRASDLPSVQPGVVVETNIDTTYAYIEQIEAEMTGLRRRLEVVKAAAKVEWERAEELAARVHVLEVENADLRERLGEAKEMVA